MNILYYDLRKIRLPEPMDEDEEDEVDRGENNDCNHFISIGIDQRYQKGHMLDIYVSLVTDFQHKLIVHLNEHEQMRNLLEKIKESIDQKYDHLRGLNGLQVIDLKRVTGIDLNKGAASVSRALKNPMSSIPTKGRVSQVLRANDHLLCDIDSLDIWIKFKLVIETPENTLVEVEFEVKFDKTVMGEVFMRILQKLIIQIWNQYWQDTREQPGSHYQKSRNNNFVLNDLKIIQIDVGIALAQMDLESEQSGLHTTSNRSVLQSSSVNRLKKRQTNIALHEIPLDKSIGEVFNYQNNCVKVKCTIATLKDLYLQQLALNTSVMNQSYTMGSYAERPSSFKTGRILSTIPHQPSNEKQGYISAKQFPPNILVSSFSAKKRNFNEFDSNPEATQSKNPTLGNNRRVSYNVRLSKDHAYHIIDTDQTDAMDAGGNNFTLVEEDDEIMHFNHNSIQVTTEEEDARHTITSKGASKMHDSVKRKKTDQVKIPVFSGTHNSAMIHRSTEGKQTNNSQRPILTAEDEDIEARAGQPPNFGGNLQKPQTYTLFAIILGNVVLAKKNGIIVQDMSAAQIENENNLIESSQNQYSQGPLQSGYFDFETEQTLDGNNNNPRMTQNMMMRRKNSQLTEIAEEEEQDLQQSIKPQMLYGAQRSAQASKQSPQYLSLGQGEKPLADSRKASNDDQSGHSSFHDPEQALHSSSNGGGSAGQRKTARISSPEEVKELKKLARKTVINDDAGNDEDGYLGSYKKQGMSMIVETQSNTQYDRNYSKVDSLEILMVDELKQPLMMNQDFRETTIERIESTKDKNPYEHRGSQLLPTNFTAMHERKKVENRVSLAPPTRKNNDDISPRVGINNRKSSLFVTSQTKNFEDLQKKTKTTADAGGAQKKNILSNLFSKFIRGGAPEASGQKGGNKQGNLDEQMLENVTEFEMLHKVQLPAWLITHEDYQLVEIPPIKNFTISERERAQGGRDTLAMFGDIVTIIDANNVEEDEQIGVSRKNFIIVTVIVLVAILFTVGIILAIAYTSASV